MWTKILIFMITFFIVANPATFKIVRRLLGSWVASGEGLATPAGLILHALVFVSLAVFLPRLILQNSFYADEEEYRKEKADDEEEYAEDEYEDEYAEDEYEEEGFQLQNYVPADFSNAATPMNFSLILLALLFILIVMSRR